MRKPTTDRRTNHLTRRFVAEMSQKAKSHAVLVSVRTGLPSRRAFDERGVTPFVAVVDVDSMLAFNDQYSYAAGDALLRRIADLLIRVGLEAFHNRGDEFLCKGESYQELNLKLSEAQRILSQEPFPVREPNGRIHTIEGVDFCYGIGTSLEEAELALKHRKEQRVPNRTKSAAQKI